MTISKTFTIELTFIVDDEDADAMDRLERSYNSGAMQKACYTFGMARVGLDGYNGIHVAIAARNGKFKKKGEHIDHINNNAGDNRRINLRVLSAADNMMNKSNKSDKPSKYVGVYWFKKYEKWRARVVITLGTGKQKSVSCGYHIDEEKAARAYDAKVIELGLDKPLNFPLDILPKVAV